ncbi:hypothetical protein DPMN_019382 [Dreissena polymorpha]|uniref:Uncharacterized protein n=1 Tax=Dreissena polymorpha TaxID=45954 RepID=A0A9D4NEY4_DREPO|nr:hypothetical protein DPMN_019382 [Dreissena polymorpha]
MSIQYVSAINLTLPFSLSAELRENKEIAQKLTAENNDMAQDLAALRYRQSKYENDLSNAQQVCSEFRRLFYYYLKGLFTDFGMF